MLTAKVMILVMPAVLVQLLTAFAFTPQSALVWLISCMVTQIGYRMSKTIVSRQKSLIFVIKMAIPAFVPWVVCFGSIISMSFSYTKAKSV